MANLELIICPIWIHVELLAHTSVCNPHKFRSHLSSIILVSVQFLSFFSQALSDGTTNFVIGLEEESMMESHVKQTQQTEQTEPNQMSGVLI